MSHLTSPVEDITVSIEPSCIEVKGEDLNELIKFKFSDLELQPETCRGLKYLQSGELHFSVKGKPLLRDENLLNTQNHLMTMSTQGETVERIQMFQNKWFCLTCHQKLLTDGCIFSRVLPLPSENWSDYAEMWFCHNHGNEKPQQRSLLPKTKECFVGETFILVDIQHVKAGAVKVTKDGAVMCRRCGKQLGLAMETENGLSDNSRVYKIFQHTVMIRDLFMEDLLQHTIYDSGQTERFFSQLLLEQSRVNTSFRFIIDAKYQNGGIQAQNEPTPLSTCLVWLLDSNVTVYKSGVDTIQKSGMEKRREMKVLFKCRLHSANSKSSPDHVMKSVISLWKKDNTVHGLSLPHPVLLQLVSLLIDNCRSLPRSQRYLNGFHVSFIRHREVT